MKQKQRFDVRVKELYPSLSKTEIQSFIMQGKVTVEGQVNLKPGTQVNQDSQVVLTYEVPRYVSRAGFKLEKALDTFEVDPAGLTVLDAGLSTGGFTDCLLQRGALKVYGVDVGFGQTHEKILKDPRVIVMERINLRYLESLPEKVDLATLDLSFIGLEKVLPAVKKLLQDSGRILALIKPQFESERHEIGKGGIIKDPKIHTRVVEKVVEDFKKQGFVLEGLIESPLLGTQGNKEFLGLFKLAE